MILRYNKVRAWAKPPQRANPSDAGADLFYCPVGGDSSGVVIGEGKSVLIPTGLKIEVPHGYMLEIKNKSGIASRKKLVVGACVVDSGYNGEVFVNLHNIGNEPQKIRNGEKVAQAVLIPVVHCRFVESHAELYAEPGVTISNRGDGALGSTGK